MEKKLIEYIKNFELVDLLGFARIVGAKEQEDFEDFVVEHVPSRKFLKKYVGMSIAHPRYNLL